MKKLIVHIGTGKTGSTAIQQALEVSRAPLRERQLYYLGLNLEHAETERPKDWQSPSGIALLQKMPEEESRKEILEVLTKEIKTIPDNSTCVWSNESIHERPTVYIPVLQEMRSQGIKLTVVAYARKHRAYVVSAYKQWGIKHKTYAGRVLGFRDWLKQRQGFLSYGKRLALWEASFSEDFRLINYDAVDDVIDSFKLILPAEAAKTITIEAQRPNQTPPAALTALYAIHNNQYETPIDPRAMQQVMDAHPGLKRLKTFRQIKDLYPSEADLAEAAEVLSADIELVESMLRRHGQPTMNELDESRKVQEVDTHNVAIDLITALFVMLINQNDKIRELEEKINNLAHERGA
jgi:hypothetical protein